MIRERNENRVKGGAKGGREPGVLDTLASTHVTAGRFEEAVSTASRALELAQAQGSRQLAAALTVKLRLYRAGQAFIRPR